MGSLMCAEAVTARKTATRLPRATNADHYDQHAEWSQATKLGKSDVKVVTKSSGRQPWLVTRSQAPGASPRLEWVPRETIWAETFPRDLLPFPDLLTKASATYC